MRLIQTSTLQMKEFFSNFPPYTILSHTWEADEVSFQDFQDLHKASSKRGYSKIYSTCQQAMKDHLEWCWIDTCCIDKTSSAELSEAINSMFAWYRDSTLCYAYLEDIDAPKLHYSRKDLVLEAIPSSRWFTRGWTLQEFLAPRDLVFYNQRWEEMINKYEMAEEVESSSRRNLNGIDFRFLKDSTSIFSASVAERMSWMSARATTRKEDSAYCLLGIFRVNMPLLYGEGSRAFVRLQEEILRRSTDQTIFCWSWPNDAEYSTWSSILSPSPGLYYGFFEPFRSSEVEEITARPYQLTNAGLSIWMQLIPTLNEDIHMAVLEAIGSKDFRSCIPVQRNPSSGVYHRLPRHGVIAIQLKPNMTLGYKNIYLNTDEDTRDLPTAMVRGLTAKKSLLRVLLLDCRLSRETSVLRPWLSSANVFFDSQESVIEYQIGADTGHQQGFIAFRGADDDDHWYCVVAEMKGRQDFEIFSVTVKERLDDSAGHIHDLFDRLMTGKREFHFGADILGAMTWQTVRYHTYKTHIAGEQFDFIYLSDDGRWNPPRSIDSS